LSATAQVPEFDPGDGDVDVAGTEPTQRQATVTPTTNIGPRAVAIRARTIWLAAAVVIGGIVCWVVVREAFQILLLLFMAIVVAEGLRPLVDWLQQRRLPRSIAVLALYLIIGAILGGLGWFLFRPLTGEVKAFLVNLPRYAAQTQRLVDQVQQTLGTDLNVSQILSALPGESGQLLSFLLRGPVVLGHIIYGVIAILLLAFYWLTAVGGLKAFLVGLLPPPAQETASETVTEMGWRVGGYLRGVAVDMVVIGAFSGVGCALLGVPYPLLLGVVAGLTEALPLIGPVIGGGIAVLVALVTQDPVKAGEVALLYLVIQQIENNTLVPLVMQRAVGLNAFTVVIALLTGGALLGILGALLAVPAAAVLQVLVLRVLAPAARRASGAVSSSS
jgi:predicted PurR-regulated permease PerM